MEAETTPEEKDANICEAYPSDKDFAIEPENDKNLANSNKDSNSADQCEMQPVIEEKEGQERS